MLISCPWHPAPSRRVQIVELRQVLWALLAGSRSLGPEGSADNFVVGFEDGYTLAVYDNGRNCPRPPAQRAPEDSAVLKRSALPPSPSLCPSRLRWL